MNTQLATELGAIVREARIKSGKTQLDLANDLGYESMQFVSLFERGLSKIPNKVLGRLVKLLPLNEKKIKKMILEAKTKTFLDEFEAGKQGNNVGN